MVLLVIGAYESRSNTTRLSVVTSDRKGRGNRPDATALPHGINQVHQRVLSNVPELRQIQAQQRYVDIRETLRVNKNAWVIMPYSNGLAVRADVRRVEIQGKACHPSWQMARVPHPDRCHKRLSRIVAVTLEQHGFVYLKLCAALIRD